MMTTSKHYYATLDTRSMEGRVTITVHRFNSQGERNGFVRSWYGAASPILASNGMVRQRVRDGKVVAVAS